MKSRTTYFEVTMFDRSWLAALREELAQTSDFLELRKEELQKEIARLEFHIAQEEEENG